MKRFVNNSIFRVKNMCFKSSLQIQLVIFLVFVATVTSACQSQGVSRSSTRCSLPPYPKHGSYKVFGDPAATPGDELEYVYLNVSCHRGHDVVGNNVVLCIQGEWSTAMPECVPVCNLQEHPSVMFSCKKPGAEEFGACADNEPLGTTVKPECQTGYYSPAALPLMHCVNESWSYVARCTPAGCFLQESPSVTYSCKKFGAKEFGACSGHEPLGTSVKPECRLGYSSPSSMPVMQCANGSWTYEAKCSTDIPCPLQKDPSVTFSCIKPGAETFGACDEDVFPGTAVKPECQAGYYNSVALPVMQCVNKSWSYVARCTPDCGQTTPNDEEITINGREGKLGEVPWYVGIYLKTEPYMQICGGSLVTHKAVISAAHCFWNDISKNQPASMYAVAIGKIYRPWNTKQDTNAQKSDVKDIKIPDRFQGRTANYQDDIAIVILETVFVYNIYVRPVCLDFDVNFDRRQLQIGKLGNFAGWGRTSENDRPSMVLKVVKLPNMDIEHCITAAPLTFREYISSDKICAGYGSGWVGLSKEDSGGGLAYAASERGVDRYYLRGIAFTALKIENSPNYHSLFTQIVTHEYFIKQYI